MSKPTSFNSLAEAIGAANYVQQLLGAEYQWIHNRLSWLLISQSFCISAYAILSTSTGVRFVGDNTIAIMKTGLPVFGIICCLFVGIAILAATRVAQSLANERGRLVGYINENSPTAIPLPGVAGDLIEKRWTYWAGELPHWVLPWVLGAFWLSLMIW
ncbi:MAG: hypothetical protein ACLQNE_26185 [Thermoguttaceae bacterium]